MFSAEQQKEQSVQIVTPERIDRILKRTCAANLEVLMRPPGVNNMAIRGRAESVDPIGANGCFRIGHISEQGIWHLKKLSKVRVEFVGMTTQVYFESDIIARDQSSIGVEMPLLLSSVERRNNARYVARPELTGFLNLGCWSPKVPDMCAPPLIAPFTDIAGWMPIADISEGGFCAVTRFPSALLQLKRGFIDTGAKITLPMQPSFHASVEVRWFKKIKERISIDGSNRSTRTFRFGLQIVESNDQLKLAIKQYIKELSMAEAI